MFIPFKIVSWEECILDFGRGSYTEAEMNLGDTKSNHNKYANTI